MNIATYKTITMGSWIVLPNQIESPYEYFYPSDNKVNHHDNYNTRQMQDIVGRAWASAQYTYMMAMTWP